MVTRGRGLYMETAKRSQFSGVGADVYLAHRLVVTTRSGTEWHLASFYRNGFVRPCGAVLGADRTRFLESMGDEPGA